MKASKVLIAGGLIFTLGAFGPAFAQGSKDSKTAPTSYSENSDTSSPTAQPESSEQNQNASADESSTQNGRQTEDQNESSSDEQNGNQNAGAQNESSEDQAPSSQSSLNKTSQINTPTPDQLARQADHVQRQIHHLDKDLSDAVQYENTAREDWNNKDLTGAHTNFRIAEHILSNATGGATFQPAMLGQSAEQREKMAERAIDREKARGVDVSDAEQCLTQGRDALKRGDEMQASRDFREAELSLGIPVEVGYAEVWESGTPRTARSTPDNNGSPANKPEAATSSEAQTAMTSRQDRIGDARTFIDNGRRALDNGNKSEAERDFRAADHALSMNDQNLQHTSSASNSSTADPGN